MSIAKIAFRALADGHLQDKHGHRAQPNLRVVDAISCLPFEPNDAHRSFQLLRHQHERGQSLATSNHAASEQDRVFGDAVTAIIIRGDSYHLRMDSLRRHAQPWSRRIASAVRGKVGGIPSAKPYRTLPRHPGAGEGKVLGAWP